MYSSQLLSIEEEPENQADRKENKVPRKTKTMFAAKPNLGPNAEVLRRLSEEHQTDLD